MTQKSERPLRDRNALMRERVERFFLRQLELADLFLDRLYRRAVIADLHLQGLVLKLMIPDDI